MVVFHSMALVVVVALEQWVQMERVLLAVTAALVLHQQLQVQVLHGAAVVGVVFMFLELLEQAVLEVVVMAPLQMVLLEPQILEGAVVEAVMVQPRAATAVQA
jgi:hypothetical protein